jgi:hypothetical protein
LFIQISVIHLHRSKKQNEMRVRKKCPECQVLKLMNDFKISENSPDGKTSICSNCILISEEDKTENQPLNLNIMSLKEKRAAAAAEAALVAKTAKAAVKLVAEKLTEAVDPEVVGSEKPKKKPVKKAAVKETLETKAVEETVEVEEVIEAVKETLEEIEEVIEEVIPEVKAVTPKAVTPTAKVEKVIEQLDATGVKVIKKFKTLQEAADAVGATKAYLMDGLKGWSKTVKGFKWRYEGEEIVVREKKAKE